jgi:hypothetical protein
LIYLAELNAIVGDARRPLNGIVQVRHPHRGADAVGAPPNGGPGVPRHGGFLGSPAAADDHVPWWARRIPARGWNPVTGRPDLPHSGGRIGHVAPERHPGRRRGEQDQSDDDREPQQRADEQQHDEPEQRHDRNRCRYRAPLDQRRPTGHHSADNQQQRQKQAEGIVQEPQRRARRPAQAGVHDVGYHGGDRPDRRCDGHAACEDDPDLRRSASRSTNALVSRTRVAIDRAAGTRNRPRDRGTPAVGQVGEGDGADHAGDDHHAGQARRTVDGESVGPGQVAGQPGVERGDHHQSEGAADDGGNAGPGAEQLREGGPDLLPRAAAGGAGEGTMR